MWPETLDRWYAEGLDPDLKQHREGDIGAIAHDEYQRVLVYAFGMDRLDYLRNSVISGYTESPFYPAFERVILEEDDRSRIVRDTDGIVKREFIQYSMSSMPQFLRYPVSSRSDWLKLIPRLDPDEPQRFASDWEQVTAYYAERSFPVGLTICGAFGHPRNLFGVEGLCLAYYDQPALIHEVMEHWVEFYCRLMDRVWQSVQFDFILIWEDMAYKNGPLISPQLVRTFMLPYYRQLIDHTRLLGCDIIIVDSDGDVSLLVPLFLEAGVNAMLPFEVQSGMDVRQFQAQYGDNLAMIGGLDKRVLPFGSVAIQDELRSRMIPMLREGGYIPCLDHTAPPKVSLHNFSYYIQSVRALAQISSL
jgi:uroporphyrinogen decarboxylase